MKMFLKKFCLFLKSDLWRFASQIKSMENPVVALKDGKLRGAIKQLYDGSDYYSFKGIPYALPPVGELRFKAPLPPKPWDGILDATNHGPVCPHTTLAREIFEGDENCLFLNVYTRSLTTDSNIPVMVNIHGGGFQYGSGDDSMYGPDFLLMHDVVLVTFNYRLEAFGFLCLDTPQVPGNAGMKDQVAALVWVQKNIRLFGGDPENVTLFGESAGGASVTYHMLSDMSKGLFNKAISQSGVCLHDWAIDNDGRARAFRVGKVLGKDTNDTQELLEFLQSVPSKHFIGMNFKVASKDEKHRGLPLRFGPVVEKKFHTEGFINETPLDLLLAGKFNPIPLIIGYNSREGLFIAPTELNKVDFANKFPSFLVPKEIARRVSQEKLKEYGDRIKHFYCGNRDLNSEDVDIISDMQTDVNFSFGIYRMANMYSSLCKVTYMYRFNLCTELNFFKAMLGLSEYKGVPHADDLFYVFKNSCNKDIYEEKEKIRDYVYMVTKIWTDFAKTGNPTPDGSFNVKWLPYTSSNKQYLNIDEKLEMGKNADRERLDFWTKLYKEVGLPCDIKSNL